MKKLLLALGILSVIGVTAVLGVAYVLSSSSTTEVLIITPAAPEAVEMNKMLWEEGEPVDEIYGVPASEAQLILFADESRIIRPEEDPGLVLYTVVKEEGENPLQEKTIWFFSRWALIGLALFGFFSFGGYALLRMRK
jgi:hypothetical protein